MTSNVKTKLTVQQHYNTETLQWNHLSKNKFKKVCFHFELI